MEKIGIKRIIDDVIIGMVAVGIGEKIWDGISLRRFKKTIEKGGPLFINNTTKVIVIVEDVISGGLFRSPSVIYAIGEQRLQTSVKSFTESFQQCKIIVRD